MSKKCELTGKSPLKGHRVSHANNKMKRKLTYFTTCIFIFLLITASSRANEIKILYKIENEIITNYDIVTEKNYLIALNNSLEKNHRSLKIY